jgi:uncharacterized oligopeptide transporter (OPT) family protein
VTAGAGAQTALAVNVLKAGHLLQAPPRTQLRAQMIGAVIGLGVALPAYALVKDAYGLGSAVMPAPSAQAWKALAELAEKGAASLPPWAGVACLAAAAIGVGLSLLERTRLAPYLPSPVALGAAFLAPMTICGTVAVGALAYFVVLRFRPHVEPLASAAAAGGIAGESLLGFLVAVLTSLRLFG